MLGRIAGALRNGNFPVHWNDRKKKVYMFGGMLKRPITVRPVDMSTLLSWKRCPVSKMEPKRTQLYQAIPAALKASGSRRAAIDGHPFCKEWFHITQAETSRNTTITVGARLNRQPTASPSDKPARPNDQSGGFSLPNAKTRKKNPAIKKH